MNRDQLILSKELYHLEAIQTARMAYRRLCDIDIVDDQNAWALVFSNCRYGAERTIMEFENYLIYIMGSKNK